MSGEGVIPSALGEAETFELQAPALAVAMPRDGKIALFVKGRHGRPGRCDLEIGEAAQLHATLGSALSLMKRPGLLVDHRPPLEARFIIWIRNALLGLALAVVLAAVFILPALLTGGRP